MFNNVFLFIAVNYYMAIPHQSCDQACKSHDQVCLDIDHGLSRTYNAKTIIESLIGHTCLTGFTKTDSYSNGAHPIYKPNQRCVGWKNVPEKINCALWWPNVDGLRLCPCNKGIVRIIPSTPSTLKADE